jgi:ABC-type multidrug transport system fused ATPase/permease subunit
LDFVLTLVSVAFNYTTPFFLKYASSRLCLDLYLWISRRILDAIDDETPVNRSRAYVYAFLAFICSMCKVRQQFSSTILLITQITQAQADVQHLWLGRRAATRMRSQLMAAIYEKALKRKDFSGVVNKDNPSESTSDGKKDSKASAEAQAKADDPKAGADVGKIVNLMAGDANRVAMTSSSMYFIYGSTSCQFLLSIPGQAHCHG